MSELRARIRGVGLWAAQAPSFSAWVDAGCPEQLADADEAASALRPPANLLHPRLRRRTSTLTRAVVTAVEAAAAQGGADIGDARYVLVSSYGEIETTVDLLGQLSAFGAPISPTKFHNSVHNTATGYLSIASGNHRSSTALSGGSHGLEVGVLEALAGLQEPGAGDCLLLFAEEQLPAPMDRPDSDPTFAVAFHLSADAGEATQPGALDVELCLVPSSGAAGPGAAGPGAAGRAGDSLGSVWQALLPLLRGLAELEAGGDAVFAPLAVAPEPGVALPWQLRLCRRPSASEKAS
ncbi:beta-ketoacyl synthase chain length factor [Pseudenhygromyxa sp. WMMC2535]|uniref:beta-ketoacyl synthase chain length factor n=1 Tax=Pseudenhygromyxa sp. WMMC2535 TaxID=2712867 RepID=UPI001557921A|nr:beta-ketoacyl synthase chain length factor [Pseudenhygromyxa sp. WMMC2535]NVB42506.1 beta-ketoacyl synthase chain length factor [Pseudenhygromyxa sp. WMMC2535]